jgi:hypothetical protein
MPGIASGIVWLGVIVPQFPCEQAAAAENQHVGPAIRQSIVFHYFAT